MQKIFTIKQMKERRRELRKTMTVAEAFLWKLLQNKQLGERFLRQYSAGHYIIDFYCPKYKLAIELDGKPHFTPEVQQYDRERTAFLNSVGITVLRFENCTVFDYTQQVLEEIRMNLK